MRPHLDYGRAVWQPHLVRLIKIIKNMQIKATKLAHGLKDLSYEEYVRELNLPSLEFGIALGGLIKAFNHLHHYDKSSIYPEFF